MNSLNIRTLLFEVKIFQPTRQYIQFQPSQLLYTRHFNAASCRCYPSIVEQTSNTGQLYYKQYQTKHSSSNSLPNKNAFIQALRKQFDDVKINQRIDKEKIKLKSQKEVVKAIGLINEMITRNTLTYLTSSQILSFYINFNSLYSTKPFYLNLISYLLRQCAKYDRLDLVNIIFARFIYDVDMSTRKYLLGALVIKVWNVMFKIYADKGRPEEVIGMYRTMCQYGTLPNVQTYSTLIKSAAKANVPYECFEFLEKIISKGEKTNSETLNSLLQACISSEDPSIKANVNMILDLMSYWKVGPNGKTFLILLQHCKSYEELEVIWTKILKYGLCNNRQLQERIIKICCTQLSFDENNDSTIRMSKYRSYTWRLIEGIFSKPKTIILPKSLLNSMILTLGRLRDIRGIMEFYQEKIDFFDKNYNRLLLDKNHNPLGKIFMFRTKHVPMDVKLFNIFMRAISDCKYGPLSCAEFIQHTSIGLRPNHISVKYLFASIQSKYDFKLFGSALFQLIINQGIIISKDLWEDVIRNTIQNISKSERIKMDYRTDVIIKYLVNEIINVQEGKDLFDCLNKLEMS
ncbi:16104_t:CDS:2 [Funneliformis mosseae]|uniref:16104_t:CDS:1 n=1 Tax=Funneliformis mosseae TaxID=27381 RepID=A0A9N9AXC2_FUNMO|nr:16104_t:CDS:2 [Funneliformis mosseae]